MDGWIAGSDVAHLSVCGGIYGGLALLLFLPSTDAQLGTGTGTARYCQVNTARRGIQTLPYLTGKANEILEDHRTCSDDSKALEVSDSIESKSKDGSIEYTAMSNLKTSKRHDLAMVFTCKVCETRSVKTVCRESYEKGVVVVRCGGCNNLHLIADRLGWFGEPGCIEELLAARGEEVKKGSVDSLSLTVEDLVGARSS
ncbi:uncharacterized protein LOC131243357 isoform X2 [Magnolia sinica]|uniref:uncharacterized protein LOC131243357 isoform X2 n=1 Tax=Magnolia sinica TaxID=86752 RepID=UPI00265A1F00|nr:uncharacterized protein LOC131243357 isoform X2 [Magnolia sinica]